MSRKIHFMEDLEISELDLVTIWVFFPILSNKRIMGLQTLGFCPLKKLPEAEHSRNHTSLHGSHHKFAIV